MCKMLFLDDERHPSEVKWIVMPQGDWTIVRSAQEFMTHILEQGMCDVISFDNDLGEDGKEGKHCARWLAEVVMNGKVAFNPNFKFTVHSMNPIAKSYIISFLNQFIEFMKSENKESGN